MKILVVGGGGREHAIVKSLKKSAKVEKIYAVPGNGGIALDAEVAYRGRAKAENEAAFRTIMEKLETNYDAVNDANDKAILESIYNYYKNLYDKLDA